MNGILFLVEVMYHGLSGRSDASPSPCQAGRAEQRCFDRERIEARHIFRRVRSFDVELIGLSEHGGRIACSSFCVQRHL